MFKYQEISSKKLIEESDLMILLSFFYYIILFSLEKCFPSNTGFCKELLLKIISRSPIGFFNKLSDWNGPQKE